MVIKILKPFILSVLLFFIMFLTEWFDFIFNRFFNYRNYLFYMYWPIVIIIFLIFNKNLPSEINNIEPKEKRKSILGLFLIAFLSIVYFLLFTNAFFPSDLMENPNVISFNNRIQYSLVMATPVLVLLICVYLGANSIYLMRKKITNLGLLEFFISLLIYVTGALIFLSSLGYGAYFIWPVFFIVLLAYVLTWTFFWYKINHQNSTGH